MVLERNFGFASSAYWRTSQHELVLQALCFSQLGQYPKILHMWSERRLWDDLVRNVRSVTWMLVH